nr:melanocortin-2 receptor accessory protein [Anolis sagrei ordinatus]
MANRTNISDYIWSYEYYMDYLDPIPVDASKLKANRHSIIIAFWIGLASFVAFLFFILFYMSQSDSPLGKNRRLEKRFLRNYSKNIHQNLGTNHDRPTSDDNRVEEIEGICSDSRSPCHSLNNMV